VERDVASFYDDFVDYSLVYLRTPNRRLRRVHEHLRPLLARGPRSALDVGCGLGITTGWLAARVPRVVGVDISQRAVRVARQLHPRASFEVCALPGDELPPGPFDLVTLVDSVEHVPRDDLRAAFERISGVPAEDGVLALNLPSRLFALRNDDPQVVDEAVGIDLLVSLAADVLGMEPLVVSRYGVEYASQYVFCAFARSYDVTSRTARRPLDAVKDLLWQARLRLVPRRTEP